MRSWVIAAVILCAVTSAAAEDAQANPSAGEIIRKLTAANEQRTNRLKSYRSTRTYEVEYKGFGGDRHAKMIVTATYAAQQKSFHVVSEEGSKLLLNRVIRKALESEQEAATAEMRSRSALTEANYSFEFLTREVADGKTSFVLQVKPKRKDKYLYDGKIWIDASEFALARVEAEPARNPSFWITSATIEHINRSVRS